MVIFHGLYTIQNSHDTVSKNDYPRKKSRIFRFLFFDFFQKSLFFGRSQLFSGHGCQIVVFGLFHKSFL